MCEQLRNELLGVRTTFDEFDQFSSNTPVGTANMFIEQGLKNFGAVHGRLHRSMRRFLKQLYDINARTVENEEIIDKFGELLVTTGNKSEMSVGYATLYGDMCGGYAVLKDVYKTTVFAVCRWRNAHKPAGALGPKGPVMPENVITKPPTAELKPNQKDQDTLPPYEILDAILELYVEHQLSADEIISRGYEEATVRWIQRRVDFNEWKRHQAAPGLRVTSKVTVIELTPLFVLEEVM